MAMVVVIVNFMFKEHVIFCLYFIEIIYVCIIGVIRLITIDIKGVFFLYILIFIVIYSISICQYF
jgi:hypothetical protein